MHSIKDGKTIDESTKLYNPNDNNDFSKTSSYIYNAFLGSHNLEIEENLKENISYIDLLDMLSFDRADFEKDISTSAKKKITIESKWEQVKISKIASDLFAGGDLPKNDYSKIKTDKYQIPIYANSSENKGIYGYTNKSRVDKACVTISARGTIGYTIVRDEPFFPIVRLLVLIPKEDKAIPKYLETVFNKMNFGLFGASIPQLTVPQISDFKIPLPPLDIQKMIVSEIKVLEAKENKAKEEIEKGKETIVNLFNQAESKADKIVRLSDENIFQVSIGKRVLKNEFVENGKIPVYSANVIEPFGSIDKLLIEDFSKPSVLWGIDGDWMVNHLPKDYPFYPTDHCGVLRVKDNSINEKYLAFILEKEGKVFEFSRTKRASIDRIQGIKIPVPPLSEQQKFVSEIEKIEEQIKTLETEISEIPKQKEVILKKYL